MNQGEKENRWGVDPDAEDAALCEGMFQEAMARTPGENDLPPPSDEFPDNSRWRSLPGDHLSDL